MAGLTLNDVQRWIDGYVKAWTSNAPDDIGALFTDDAVYHDRPFRGPTRGREAIVADWIARKDEPGTWEAAIAPLAADPDTGIGIATGQVHYRNGPSFSNLWVIHFGDGGRCSDFTEWWIQQPDPEV